MEKEIGEILQKLKNTQQWPGRLFQDVARYKASSKITTEIEAIYYLMESHSRTLRHKTAARYLKFKLRNVPPPFSLNKAYINLPCNTIGLDDKINEMLKKIKELPDEWTLIQMTPMHNPYEFRNIKANKIFTTGMHLCVFNCGKDNHGFTNPFMITSSSPKDPANNHDMELLQMLYDLVQANKNFLCTEGNKVVNNSQKLSYATKRKDLDYRLRELVEDLEKYYLREWKCLLFGKYINKSKEIQLKERLRNWFYSEIPLKHVMTERVLNILVYVTKAYHHLKQLEFFKIIQYLFPNLDDNELVLIRRHIKSIYEEMQLAGEKRHPIILILDDTLDAVPWEMMSVVRDQPISRMNSLYFLYGLYKEHEKTIKNGYKILSQVENGRYLINPDLELKNMERRIVSFLNYWLPEWKGIAGRKPTPEEFTDLLTKSEIFSYNGHGSGSHLFSTEKIQRIRVNGVVLLFGCSSARLTHLGPLAEPHGPYQMYFIACSPLILGMLWEVTDLETDVITTEFLSSWLPSKSAHHWKYLDKSLWKKGVIKVDSTQYFATPKQEPNEKDLLRAVSRAKRSSNVAFYFNQTACVVRGIPVKIITN